MNVGLHQIAQSFVDPAVLSDPRQSVEGWAADFYVKVTATAGGTGMAGVRRTVVNDFKLRRLQNLQRRLYFVDAIQDFS